MKKSLHYILKDHLGSWTVIANDDGVLEQELSYDAWGNQRDPETWTGSSTAKPMFDRGYTGHEHMSAFGLINMNGRCYDPVTSSFLSVDAYVQSPESAQGFNRYSYCQNNPLRYTDPTGWQMVGGNRPDNPFHEDWSVSHSAPAHGPSAFMNAYNLVNWAMYGNLNGPNFPDMTSGGASFGSWQGTYGYQVAYQSNSVYNYTFPSTQLQLIRNWHNNPCRTTNSDVLETGITNVTVGVVNYGGGLRTSFYGWKTASGQEKSASVWYESVGGNATGCYALSLQPLEWYGEGTRQMNKANLLAQSLGIPFGTIANGMECAAKAYNNVSVLSGNLSKAQYVNALTKEGYGMLRGVKGLGVAGAIVSVGTTAYKTFNYRLEGGSDPNVFAKSTLDAVMVGVGFLGPVGFGISTVYFIVDLSTNGLYGWGAIPDNY